MPRTNKGSANESARAFLKAYRQAAGLTQVHLSKRIKVKQQQISKYETGKDKVPFELVVTIEELWGVSVRGFMGSGNWPTERGTEGFAMNRQVGYLANLPFEIQEDADGQRGEQMTLDLSPIEDPSGRQKVRDPYQTLLNKQNGA